MKVTLSEQRWSELEFRWPQIERAARRAFSANPNSENRFTSGFVVSIAKQMRNPRWSPSEKQYRRMNAIERAWLEGEFAEENDDWEPIEKDGWECIDE